MKPARIKQAAEQVDEQIRALSAVPTESPEADGEPSPVASGDHSETNPTEPEPTPAHGGDAGDDEAARLRAELDALRAEKEKAEQRWRTLDGMIRAQNEQVKQYKEQLDELKAATTAPAAEQKPAEPAYSQDDVALFGEDMVKFVERVGSAAVRAEIAALRAELAELREGVTKTTQVSEATAKERFEAKLGELAPNWQTLDADEQFITWLRSNPAIGQSFASGVNALDYKSVAEIFNLYGKLVGADTPAVKPNDRKQRLEEQVAPPKARQPSAAAAEAPAETVWALSEIKELYTSRTHKGRKLSKDEFEKLERAVAEAQSQGRVDFSR